MSDISFKPSQQLKQKSRRNFSQKSKKKAKDSYNISSQEQFEYQSEDMRSNEKPKDKRSKQSKSSPRQILENLKADKNEFVYRKQRKFTPFILEHLKKDKEWQKICQHLLSLLKGSQKRRQNYQAMIKNIEQPQNQCLLRYQTLYKLQIIGWYRTIKKILNLNQKEHQSFLQTIQKTLIWIMQQLPINNELPTSFKQYILPLKNDEKKQILPQMKQLKECILQKKKTEAKLDEIIDEWVNKKEDKTRFCRNKKKAQNQKKPAIKQKQIQEMIEDDHLLYRAESSERNSRHPEQFHRFCLEFMCRNSDHNFFNSAQQILNMGQQVQSVGSQQSSSHLVDHGYNFPDQYLRENQDDADDLEDIENAEEIVREDREEEIEQEYLNMSNVLHSHSNRRDLSQKTDQKNTISRSNFLKMLEPYYSKGRKHNKKKFTSIEQKPIPSKQSVQPALQPEQIKQQQKQISLSKSQNQMKLSALSLTSSPKIGQRKEEARELSLIKEAKDGQDYQKFKNLNPVKLTQISIKEIESQQYSSEWIQITFLSKYRQNIRK